MNETERGINRRHLVPSLRTLCVRSGPGLPECGWTNSRSKYAGQSGSELWRAGERESEREREREIERDGGVLVCDIRGLKSLF